MAAADYIVKETSNPWHPKIFVEEKEVAEIRTLADLSHVLAAKNGNEWGLNARVQGEVRPFSMTVNQLKASKPDPLPATPVLLIIDRLFFHNGEFYMLSGTPEGRPVREFSVGRKLICRLNNFPFPNLNEIDHGTRSKLGRFRGTEVGELEGLGKGGHRVRVSDELGDIGLPLAASCYLLYSTP